MTKIKKIKMRRHPRKVVTYITFVFLTGLYGFWKEYNILAPYTTIKTWERSSIISLMILITIYLIICFSIFIKYRKTKYSINIEKNICIKKEKEFEYKYVYYTQTFLQRIFGLSNIYLTGDKDTRILVLKDVSKKSVKYLEATKLRRQLKGK